MESTWEVIYQYAPDAPGQATVIIRPTGTVQPQKTRRSGSPARSVGFILLAIALGGIAGPFIPAARLEAFYWAQTAQTAMKPVQPASTGTASASAVASPLTAPDGTPITPVNTDFSLIIPAIGVNAPVIANVDPTKPGQYDAALLQGVAHSSTSFMPDQDGTVYLFSHSTNYDWFVKDLNAVFYLLKNLKTGEAVDIMYKGHLYAYTIRETKIVNPRDISYLVPVVGTKSLILETCWPPGSTSQRLLVLADLVGESGTQSTPPAAGPLANR